MIGIRISLSWIFITFLLYDDCFAYNIESRLPLFKYGPKESKFGFSVEQYRHTLDATVGTKGTLLVAGAPTALSQKEGSKIRYGGVFYCPVTTRTNDCSRVAIDVGGNTTRQFENNVTDQWLGARVASEGPGKILMTCAHRYSQVNKRFIGTEDEKQRLYGKCFVLNATSDGRIEEITHEDDVSSFVSTPTQSDKYPRVAVRNANFHNFALPGASIVLTNNEALLGVPGGYGFTGTLFNFDVIDGGNSFYQPSCDTKENKNNVLTYLCENLRLFRDSYLGFSVAVSDRVDGRSPSVIYYASGAPRGRSRSANADAQTGAVKFFKRTTIGVLEADNLKTVYGDKILSSFGYSIALIDVNGDNLMDLIVGAPQYFLRRKYGGAIYVYINKKFVQYSSIEPSVFFGPPDSYFGHSIANMGDIDQDGYNDFAVGAPYQDVNGAVYIFKGGPKGVTQSQIIRGSDYPYVEANFKKIEGFGSSLSGSVDADGNGYPDLLIGTYSDSMALFRSRPVITAIPKLTLTLTDMTALTTLDLTDKRCLTADGNDYTCFKMTFCLNNTLSRVNYPDGVPMTYKVSLDGSTEKGKKTRLHLGSSQGESFETGTFTLPQTEGEICPCDNRDVYFDSETKDKLTDLKVEVEFAIDAPELRRERPGDPVINLTSYPVLNKAYKDPMVTLVKISNTCGENGCQSDLKISADMPAEIQGGEDNSTFLTINVSNEGEEAHQAYIEIYLPPLVDFVSSNIAKPSTENMTCYSAISGESSFVKCSLGNPYMGGASDTIKIELSTIRLDERTKTINIRIVGKTTSDNPELPPVELQSRVVVSLDVALSIVARPDQVIYSDNEIAGESAMKNAEKVGPQVHYTFNVENTGLRTATGVELYVDLPIELCNGKWLLYLVSAEVTVGEGTCNGTHINPLGLQPKSLAASKRRKRSASPDPYIEARQSSSGGGPDYVLTLSDERHVCNDKHPDASGVRTVTIDCTLDVLGPGTTTSVEMEIHVWQATFLEEFKEVDFVFVRTQARLGTSNANTRLVGDPTSSVIQTSISHDVFASDVVAEFPWWYIFIGVIILLIIYAVIIYLLIRFGFFTRKKFRRHDEEDDGRLEEIKEKDDSL